MPGALTFRRQNQGHTGTNKECVLIDVQGDMSMEYNDEKKHMDQPVCTVDTKY